MVVKKTERGAVISKSDFEAAASKAYGLLDNLPNELSFHCRDHTEQIVVPGSLEIARLENLTPENCWLVGIAALFHDTGFTKQYIGNEPIGAKLAEEYMRTAELAYTEAQIQAVTEAILNTNMKNNPPSQLAEVLRDADLSAIGRQDFLTWQNRLRAEVLVHPESPMFENAKRDKVWGKFQLNFLVSHRWFTKSAVSLFEEQKKKNIGIIRSRYFASSI